MELDEKWQGKFKQGSIILSNGYCQNMGKADRKEIKSNNLIYQF